MVTTRSRACTEPKQQPFLQAVEFDNCISAMRIPDSESASTSDAAGRPVPAADAAACTSASSQHSPHMESPTTARQSATSQPSEGWQMSAPTTLLHRAVDEDTVALKTNPRIRKRRKGHARGPAAGKHIGLIGRIVDVPACVFSVDIPDMYYRGLITKRDRGHKDSFEVKFLEDGTRYWLPIADCCRWLKEMNFRGRTDKSQTIGAASDNFAALILAGFAGSSESAGGDLVHGPSLSSAAHQSLHNARPQMCSSPPDISNLQRLAAAV